MKRIISFLTFIFILSAGLSFKAIGVQAEGNESMEMIRAYYDVINSIVNGDGESNQGIGVYTSEKGTSIGVSNNNNQSGLVFAELVDFDGDGKKELFCFYLKSGSYIYEIWGFDGKANKITSFKDNVSSSIREIKNLKLETVDGKFYIHNLDMLGGPAGLLTVKTENIDSFYTVKENKWVEEETLSSKAKITDEEIKSYQAKRQTPPEAGTAGNPLVYSTTRNGATKELSKTDYDNALKNYTKGKTISLINDHELGTDISNDNKQLNDFISSLRDKVYNLAVLQDVYSQKSDDEKKALVEFINKFVHNKSWVNEFDVDNFDNELDKAIYYLRNFDDFKGIISEKNDKDGMYYYKLPLDKLNVICESLFGVKIKEDNKNVHDGYYYAPDGAKGYIGFWTNDVNKMYEIGDGVYYLDIKRTYTEMGKEYPDTPGYIVVKEIQVDGKKRYNLLKYNDRGGILTTELLNEYKKQASKEASSTDVPTSTNNDINNSSKNVIIYSAVGGAFLVILIGIYFIRRRKKTK